MSDFCTIFCKNDEPSKVLKLIKKSLKPFSSIQNLSKWESVPIRTGASNIKLSRQIFTEAGDKFSKIILTTHNRFRMINTSANQAQKLILDYLDACELAIGVVSEPSFDEESGHFDLIFEIANNLNGIIFNGSGMLDGDGNIIRDIEGNC